jgi:carboxyl-terminal processing protease
MKKFKAGSGKYLIIIVFLIGALGGSVLSFGVTSANNNRETYIRKLQIFNSVLGYVRDFYVEDENLEPEKMIYGAVDGLLETLDDPYTELMRPERFENMQTETSQEFGGLGIFITIRDRKLTVIAPIAGTPAMEAGIQPGDTIDKIDGESTEDITNTSEAVKILRGPKGTEVNLTLGRRGKQFEVTIVRDEIPIKSVFADEYNVSGHDIAYLKITNFGERTYSEVKEKIDGFEKNGFDGMILDLRNNPGGLLTAAYQVANTWIEEGKIVYTKGRASGQSKNFPASSTGTEEFYPMLVLVNQGSASGSEIVTGSLKDHKRAVIAGDTTFGKGKVQSIFPLDDGSALKITTAYYYTPGGYQIESKGIPPQIPIKQEFPDTGVRNEISKLLRGDTILTFLQDNPEPSEKEIQNLIEKLQEQGFSLEDRYLKFYISRQQSAMKGKTTLADPAMDHQLKQALEYFAPTLDETSWRVEDVVAQLEKK